MKHFFFELLLGITLKLQVIRITCEIPVISLSKYFIGLAPFGQMILIVSVFDWKFYFAQVLLR